MARLQLIIVTVFLFIGANLALEEEANSNDNLNVNEPFLSKKSELFRFSRSAKGGLQLAKYEQQQQVNNDEQSPQVEVSRETVVPAQLPAFSGETKGPAISNDSVESSSSSSSQKSSKSSKTITTTTTTTQQQTNQDQPRIARLQEVRVHTVPLSEAVHYANYVVVPSVGSKNAARLEEASSSSSSSQKSSSSSTREETEVVAPVAPSTSVILPPVSAPVGPDCVLQRLIVERPVNSALVLRLPSGVSSSQSSSSSQQSSRIVESSAVEPPAVVPPVCCIVKKVAPVYTAKLVVPPPADDGSLKEEHYHSESRSSREESHGLGHVSSSSSSSQSSSSRTSKSTTTSQTAALLAPPVPTVTLVHRQIQPVVTVKAAPLIALSQNNDRANSYSVDVQHHYNGPNVKYGYSIKQQSQEPQTKGLLVGERVVYLN